MISWEAQKYNIRKLSAVPMPNQHLVNSWEVLSLPNIFLFLALIVVGKINAFHNKF